jgi:hypothetical protein
VTVSAKRVRTPNGTEQVLVELADFQALLDMVNRDSSAPPDDRSIVRRLERALDAAEETVELNDLLRDYDAAHGTR